MKQFSTLTLSLLFGVLGASGVALASSEHDHSGHGHTAAASATLTNGEIKKIDKDAGKITIKHGDIKNLNMPAMTMSFQAKDKAMLDKAKVGDKVSFAVDNIDGKLTLVQLEIK